MASNQENPNSQTKPQSPTHSADEKHVNPPPTAAYPIHPPPYPMYYPPPGGYPQSPDKNKNPYPYPYPYPNTYPPGYPYPSTDPYADPPATSTAGARFIRSFILFSCVLLTCVFILTIIISVTLRPELPIYKVETLSVTNFTTPPTLGGDWVVKVSIENPNGKLVAFFAHVRVDVAYKDAVVADSQAPGFVLNTHETREVRVRASSSKAQSDMVEYKTEVAMKKERDAGAVMFDLTVYSVSKFKSGSLATRRTDIVAICQGLKVEFDKNGTGNLHNVPVECVLYI